MGEVLRDALNFLFEQHYGWFVTIFMTLLITIIGLILKLIKKPIKHFTAKIKNERIRKLVNKCIIVLSFGIATGVWFLLNHFFPKYFAIDWVQIVLSGALPVVVYAIFDGVISVDKVKNLASTIIDAAADGKITNDELKKIGAEMSNTLDEESREQPTDATVSEKITPENVENSEPDGKPSAEDALKKLLGE